MVFFNTAYLYMQNRIRSSKERMSDFFKSEAGVGAIVATIILLLIVVVLVGIFFDRLSEWITGVLDDLFGEGESTTKKIVDTKKSN